MEIVTRASGMDKNLKRGFEPTNVQTLQAHPLDPSSNNGCTPTYIVQEVTVVESVAKHGGLQVRWPWFDFSKVAFFSLCLTDLSHWPVTSIHIHCLVVSRSLTNSMVHWSDRREYGYYIRPCEPALKNMKHSSAIYIYPLILLYPAIFPLQAKCRRNKSCKGWYSGKLFLLLFFFGIYFQTPFIFSHIFLWD